MPRSPTLCYHYERAQKEYPNRQAQQQGRRERLGHLKYCLRAIIGLSPCTRVSYITERMRGGKGML
jgi:hypothetical protein